MSPLNLVPWMDYGTVDHSIEAQHVDVSLFNIIFTPYSKRMSCDGELNVYMYGKAFTRACSGFNNIALF